jgi:hypothetical protein
MSAQAAVRALAGNEARALLPAWSAGAVAAGVAALADGDVQQYSRLACGVAIVALGAQAFGHEYAHRTLGLVLALPIDRRRLLAVKLAVLVAMMLPLWTAAVVLRLFDGLPAPAWIVPAIAVCLAPALTMICRSQLAGLVFGLTIPATAFVVIRLFAGTSWDASPAADRAALAWWSQLMIPTLAMGAVMAWPLFARLEALDGAGAAMRLGWWSGAARQPRPSRPVWQLLKKELRLQQMTFAVTAVCLALCAIAALAGWPRLDRDVSFVGAVMVTYGLGLPTLIGSLGIAAERQLGTLAWQLQLPVPAWQQWSVKIAMVFSLALLLSIGLPVLLVPLLSAEPAAFRTPAVLAIVMTAVSLYISSLCANVVRAVVTSVVAVALLLLMLDPALLIGREGVWTALLAGLVIMLVGFAFVNHRAEPPPAARVWRQGLAMTMVMGGAVAVLKLTAA